MSLTKEQIQAEVARLAEEERVRSYEIGNGRFNSGHEGYAVIKEEVEEVAEDLDYMSANVEKLWRHIRGNCPLLEGAAVENIYASALAAAYEAIQVAAMAKKYLESL